MLRDITVICRSDIKRACERMCVHKQTNAHIWRTVRSIFLPHIVPLSLQGPRCSARRERAAVLVLGYVLFSPVLHVSKKGPIIVARAQTPAGQFHFRTCGSGIFQTRTEGSERCFRVQRHVFKLDMAFNYFVAV